ncbi:hypothetical protein ACFE04_020951 [Oxalis oulophora]
MDKVLLSYFGEKFRSYKHKLKKKLLEQARLKLIELWKEELIARGEQTRQEEEQLVFSEEELLQALDQIDTPTGLNEYQWAKLKAYFQSIEFKESSMKGKAARATQIHTRTTGSTSYARKKHEFEVANHKISEKITYLHPSERDNIAKRNEIEKEVMLELMGPDKPGRARGHGIGVTKSEVTEFHNTLRKNQNEAWSSTNDGINVLRGRIDKQDKVIASLTSTVQNLVGELQIYCTAYGNFGGGLMDPFTIDVGDNTRQVHEIFSGHNVGND